MVKTGAESEGKASQHMWEMSGTGAGSSFCRQGYSSSCTDCGNNLHALDRKRQRLSVKDLPDGSRTVLLKNAGNHTLAGLQELRQDRDLCDVIFKVRIQSCHECQIKQTFISFGVA